MTTRPPRAERRDEQVRLLSVAAVHRGRKVLLIREEDEPYRGAWVLPGGYPRPGERLADAAVREVAEELGLEVQLESPLGVFEDLVPQPTGAVERWVVAAFLARPISPAPPQATPEAIDHAWVEPASLRPSVPPVMRSVLDAAARRLRSDRGLRGA